MTVEEFKAFLEGMDVRGCPTPEQWARIEEKIDGLVALRLTPQDGRCYLGTVPTPVQTRPDSVTVTPFPQAGLS